MSSWFGFSEGTKDRSCRAAPRTREEAPRWEWSRAGEDELVVPVLLILAFQLSFVGMGLVVSSEGGPDGHGLLGSFPWTMSQSGSAIESTGSSCSRQRARRCSECHGDGANPPESPRPTSPREGSPSLSALNPCTPRNIQLAPQRSPVSTPTRNPAPQLRSRISCFTGPNLRLEEGLFLEPASRTVGLEMGGSYSTNQVDISDLGNVPWRET